MNSVPSNIFLDFFPEIQNKYIIMKVFPWWLQINKQLSLIHHNKRESSKNKLEHKTLFTHNSVNNASIHTIFSSESSASMDLQEYGNELQN